MGAYLEDTNCQKQGTDAALAGQKQSEPPPRAERAEKAKPTQGLRPPDCGQVPVATSASLQAQTETGAVAAKPETGKEMALKTTVGTPPVMPATQVYAPQIAAASILLSVLLGMIIFKVRAERKRLCKKCPHCSARLERWADECGHCSKNIFVYPTG